MCEHDWQIGDRFTFDAITNDRGWRDVTEGKPYSVNDIGGKTKPYRWIWFTDDAGDDHYCVETVPTFLAPSEYVTVRVHREVAELIALFGVGAVPDVWQRLTDSCREAEPARGGSSRV